ncbi:MAG: rod shape-determining protein MreC [Candidatus Omnitrophica bacterium]|nr:rod shape-determining protein MreC [Candidatus Omnitrophota bacterium]MDD5355468.1 rod shape-determining protein MreC [Candidatus Omnitrophota bacterium]
MEKKKKTILLCFILLIGASLLIKSVLVSNISKNITLGLSKLPLKLVGLSFLPAESLVSCNRSLREVSVLKKENQQLKINLMQLEEAERENKRLKELLSFKDSSNFNIVAARVISFDSSNFRKSVIIDKGKKHGIKMGNSVITQDGVVGMVVRLDNSTSQIILVSDLEFSMGAKIKRSNAIGVLSGSLGGGCRLRYLDLDEDVQIGDEVVSLGQNSRFPPGIAVGIVTEVSKEQSGLTLFAIVRPKVRLSSLQEVLVVTNY